MDDKELNRKRLEINRKQRVWQKAYRDRVKDVMYSEEKATEILDMLDCVKRDKVMVPQVCESEDKTSPVSTACKAKREEQIPRSA